MAEGEPEQPERDTLIRAYAGLLLMVVIWGANFSVAKVALASVPPLAFNALRFPFAALAVLITLRLRGPIPLPQPQDVSRIVVLGLLGNVLYQQFFIFGLHHSNAGIASVLLAGTPILTALVSAALGHERVRPRTWIGVCATFIGIMLVVQQSGTMEQANGTMAGGLLMIGASVAWAAYTVGARPLLVRYGALRVTAWTLWVGTTVLVIVGLPQLLSLPRSTFTPAVWLAVLYAGALSIGLAYMIWYNGVRVIGNTRTAAYSNAVPVVALAVAWLWLGEAPSAGELIGSAVIIGGVTLAQTGR
jgi:drug/metabolite transporter (DMT)-like permease